jgi:hypothetical protein
MNRIVIPTLVLCLMVMCVICGYSADQKTEQAKPEEQAKPKPVQTSEQEKASGIIKELRGSAPDKPVILVQPLDKANAQKVENFYPLILRADAQELERIKQLIRDIESGKTSGPAVTRPNRAPIGRAGGAAGAARGAAASRAGGAAMPAGSLEEKSKPEQSKMEEQEKASAIIKELRGSAPDKPVIMVEMLDKKEEQEKAIAEIKKLGGSVTIDENNPDKPVLMVDLSYPEVTDAGLEHLNGFNRLRHLNLSKTKITDIGLEHLKGLTELATLDLSGNPVTDAGLDNLKGLTKLQRLSLTGTKVTDEGVKKLQRALWNCKIEH